MSQPPKAQPSNAASPKTSIIIDLRWTVTELLNDGHLNQDDANVITSATRTKEQLHWHPLQVIAHQHIKDRKSPGHELNLARLTDWLGRKSKLPVYHIDPLKIDVTAITKVMSYEFAERHYIMAVHVTQDEVQIVTSQPFYHDWESGLSQVVRNKIFTPMIANPADIHKFRIETYNLARSVNGAADKGGGHSGSGISNFEQMLEIKELSSADANDQHIVNIVDWLLQYAFDQRASDIHLEPRRDVGKIRFRIDGILHDIYEMPAPVLYAVTSRIKILGRMDVAEKRRPQDGRLKTKTPNRGEVELRLATLPTAFGEKMVLRVFDPDVLIRSYQELGFSQDDDMRWQSMVTRPNGIILVTGPTGSGKTTTLYSSLKQLATSEVNVCTLEDPIEMIEPTFNQVQIQHSLELTFSEGIRALLRQDPDIIMVGEIRDLETANMAIQAALTGHLVISTLHTNDAPSAVTRLLDLGVPHYLISSTVLGIMAQRLVRTLCPHCKAQDQISDEHWQMLVAPLKVKKPSKTFQNQGCLECRDTGYMGRIGVYEIMLFSQTIKDLISQEADLNSIKQQALKEGMRSLRLSGAQKIASGITTLEEVLRVTPTHQK